MLLGNNEVYVTIAGDADQLANDLKKITPLAQQAETAISGLNAAIEASGGMSAEALGQIGVASVTVFRDGVKLAVSALTEMQLKLGQISSAEARAALSGLGFDSATTRTAINDYQTLGNTFNDTGVKKDKFKVNVGALGDMMRYVRLTAFLIFMTALNDIRQVFTDAIKDANDFSIAIFGLDVAVRAWQRSGFNTSLKEVHDEIVRIQKLYPFFPMIEMDSQMARLINGVREFGLTTQQTFTLYEDAVKAAVISGKDLPATIEAMIQAVGSGRLQSVRALGIPVSTELEKEFIKALDGTTDALTVQEKAMAASGLIHKYFATLVNDTAGAEDVLGWKTKELSTTWTNFITKLGTIFAPALKGISESLMGVIKITELWMYGTSHSVGVILSGLYIIGDAYHQLSTKGSVDIKELQDAWQRNMEKVDQMAKGFAFNFGKDPLTDEAIGTPTPSNTGNQNIIDAMAKAKTEIEKINEDLKFSLEKLWTDYYRDLDKITEDGLRKDADLNLNYARQLEKLSTDLQDNIAKENRSYQDKIVADELDTQQKIVDAKEKQQQKIFDDEKKYQEALAKLRFDLENNLEDALATRDARQITRLIRAEQNAELAARIAYDNEKKVRDDKFSKELADLSLQEDQRKQKLELEHANRLREIEIQNQEEQAAAATKLLQEEADLNKNLELQRADRTKKLEQDKADLLLQIGQRTAELTKSLADEYNLTATGLAQLYQLYDSYYGPNGSLLSMLYNFYTALGSIGGGLGGGGGGKGQNMMAEGGAFVANRPTNVTFGEAGLEAAFFMPLNGSHMGNLGSSGSNISGGGSGGKSVIELWLSPDLQARVINQAQAGIVNVIMKELA